MRYLIMLAFLSVFLPSGYAAPRLHIEPPAKQIATDQKATLIVRLEWPASEGAYEITLLEPKLENLTLEDQNQSQEAGETVSQTLRFVYRPFKAGTAVIYPFEVSYRKAETNSWIPLLVEEQRIRVVPSVPIKAILGGLGIVAGLALLIFIGFSLNNFLKTRAAAKNLLPTDPKQRIYAKAEESIATFASSDAKKKTAHWADQLRTVIATYYNVPSNFTTHSEVLSFLKNQGLPAGEWNEISRLLGQVTEMRFSQNDIPAYELDQLQKTLLQYVKGKIIIGNPNS